MHVYEFDGNADFCEKVFAECTEEKWQNCCFDVKKF
jgi:hypothetical protein